jgi:hypothetical protein
MPSHVGVDEAARRLGVAPARVRALIASGGLHADKLSGRWLVDWNSVLARQQAQVKGGRPLTPRNAWALLLAASREPLPAGIQPHARWRIAQSLSRHRLADLESRLERRSSVRPLWALPGELRPLRADDALVLTGSSAAGELELELLAPETVDAYVTADHLEDLTREYGLRPATLGEANVTLRAVPDEAWLLDARRIAPSAAVGLDLVRYADSRSRRVGAELLARLDAERDDLR